MKKVQVSEGDWFAVPLREGGYGIGVVARKGRRGVLFGYFFGPKHENLPTIEAARALHPKNALFADRFGDLGIRNGKWPILGRLDSWNRDGWPMPEFGRVDEITGMAWTVRYSEDNPNEVCEERRCSADIARRLPPDGLSGYGAVELLLAQKLRD